MAKAAQLTVGAEYTISAGRFAGKTCTVMSNVAIPDGQPNQRAVMVSIEGRTEYVIPRLIDAGPARALHVVTSAPTVEDEHVLVEEAAITDPMDPRLDQYRPDSSVVKDYVSRVIAGTSLKDTDLMMHYYNARDSRGYSQNVMLVGDTQGGKTMLVQVMACLIAKAKGYPKPLPIFTLSGSAGVTDYDLFGQPTSWTDERGRERLVWLPGLLDLAARVECILYVDEGNMMPERVTSSMHPFLDDRRTFVNRAKAVCLDGVFMPEQVKVTTGCWVIGTYNAGYRGAGAFNEAFSNRFRHLPWDYDAATEKKLIKSPVVILLGDALRDARTNRHINTPVGTKALVRLVDDINALGVKVALWAFVGIFPPNERIKVETIITDRSIESLLLSEFGQTATQDEPVVEPF